MKRVEIAIWTLLLLCFLVFFVNYIANEGIIRKYEKGKYTENKLSVLGFMEPYISHYNRGNILYKMDDYEAAVEEYERALRLNPPHDRECKIRINLVLAMVASIDSDEITESNVNEVIQLLEEGEDILYEHGCARSDDNGHNEDAQKLKEDIDKFLEELKNRRDLENDADTQGDKEKEKEAKESIENEQEKKEKLKEIQREGTEERNSELQRDEYMEDFEFYDGITW
ncbi:MAG: tetratricopeptide repeat protein [Lachnospiraceae bacterium]|nr:tetratricopeptide repeat protein [Lachnospiraceae bacterium]